MRKNNLVVCKNVRNSKQVLVESIMAKVAPIVKNALTEVSCTKAHRLNEGYVEDTIYDYFDTFLNEYEYDVETAYAMLQECLDNWYYSNK